MRIAFVDDSEQTSPPRRGLGHLVAVGAVVTPDSALAGLEADLLAIRTAVGVPPGEEIKWKPAKGSFLAAAGGSVVTDLRTRMLDAAAAHEVRTAVVVVDRSRAYTSTPIADLRREILSWLFERIAMCLADVDDIGVVVADKPGGGARQEGKWLSETLPLTETGTRYVAPDRVVLPILTAPSHHVPHLQLADLVVAATTAAVAGHRAGLTLGPLLLRLAHRHSLGYSNGAGIVLFPPQLLNLHYWAFGETGAARPSRQAGYTLPHRDFDYATDDGLGRVATQAPQP